jgi:hypothetical protein
MNVRPAETYSATAAPSSASPATRMYSTCRAMRPSRYLLSRAGSPSVLQISVVYPRWNAADWTPLTSSAKNGLAMSGSITATMSEVRLDRLRATWLVR